MRKGTFSFCVQVIAGIFSIWNGKVSLERSLILEIILIVSGCLLIALTIREVALSKDV